MLSSAFISIQYQYEAVLKLILKTILILNRLLNIKSRLGIYRALILFLSLQGLIYSLRILNFAKPASNWFKKKLARGKSWQNSHDEL